MLAGFIGMRVFGVSANLMSLGAIDFGLIVDGAVVMMENFIRRRAEASHAQPPPDQAGGRMALFTAAATEVARPILFGVLIIVAVYLPIFTLEGLEGKMFRPMAITVCSAILGSLLLSLTVVPVASSYLLKTARVHHEERWFVRLRERYLHDLRWAMDRPVRTTGWPWPRWRWRSRRSPSSAPSSCPGWTKVDPDRDAQAAVGLARRVGGHVTAGRADRQGVSRGQPGGHQDRTPDLATEAMGIYQGDIYVALHPIGSGPPAGTSRR